MDIPQWNLRWAVCGVKVKGCLLTPFYFCAFNSPNKVYRFPGEPTFLTRHCFHHPQPKTQ